jgi:hypothetical protein
LILQLKLSNKYKICVCFGIILYPNHIDYKEKRLVIFSL